MGIRSKLAPKFDLKRTYLPPACYTLSRMEKKVVCQTFTDLKVPEEYSNFRNLASMEKLKLYGLKSHDYYALMQQVLLVASRSVLLKHVDTLYLDYVSFSMPYAAKWSMCLNWIEYKMIRW